MWQWFSGHCASSLSTSWPACSPPAGSERAPQHPAGSGLQRAGRGDGGGWHRGGRAHGGQRGTEWSQPPYRLQRHHHHQPPGFCQRAGRRQKMLQSHPCSCVLLVFPHYSHAFHSPLTHQWLTLALRCQFWGCIHTDSLCVIDGAHTLSSFAVSLH